MIGVSKNLTIIGVAVFLAWNGLAANESDLPEVAPCSELLAGRDSVGLRKILSKLYSQIVEAHLQYQSILNELYLWRGNETPSHLNTLARIFEISEEEVILLPAGLRSITEFEGRCYLLLNAAVETLHKHHERNKSEDALDRIFNTLPTPENFQLALDVLTDYAYQGDEQILSRCSEDQPDHFHRRNEALLSLVTLVFKYHRVAHYQRESEEVEVHKQISRLLPIGTLAPSITPSKGRKWWRLWTWLRK